MLSPDITPNLRRVAATVALLPTALHSIHAENPHTQNYPHPIVGFVSPQEKESRSINGSVSSLNGSMFFAVIKGFVYRGEHGHPWKSVSPVSDPQLAQSTAIGVAPADETMLIATQYHESGNTFAKLYSSRRGAPKSEIALPVGEFEIISNIDILTDDTKRAVVEGVNNDVHGNLITSIGIVNMDQQTLSPVKAISPSSYYGATNDLQNHDVVNIFYADQTKNSLMKTAVNSKTGSQMEPEQLFSSQGNFTLEMGTIQTSTEHDDPTAVILLRKDDQKASDPYLLLVDDLVTGQATLLSCTPLINSLTPRGGDLAQEAVGATNLKKRDATQMLTPSTITYTSTNGVPLIGLGGTYGQQPFFANIRIDPASMQNETGASAIFSVNKLHTMPLHAALIPTEKGVVTAFATLQNGFEGIMPNNQVVSLNNGIQ